MNLHEHYYQALISRDARFDGQFYVGVSSTGIYCRPVCRVRAPKAENCQFYQSAAQAEAAGFRPCLRCHPESAPTQRVQDDMGQQILATLEALELSAPEHCTAAFVAAQLQISTRHLNRLCQQHLGVAISAIIQTRRLLRAKKLISETPLAITDIAFICGFGSLRSLHHHFKTAYNLTPLALRKSASVQALQNQDRLTLTLSYRPPYAWEQLLTFLSHRTIAGVEQVSANRYLRTVHINAYQGWIAVTPHPRTPHALQIEISASLSPVIPNILHRLSHLFDLQADPALIKTQLGALAANNPGLRLPGAFDGFEMAVRAILGQQITVKAAHTLAGRFAAAFGTPICTPDGTLTVCFPHAAVVAALSVDEIASLGIISKRAQCIIALAKALATESITLSPTASPAPTIAQLKALPGIGDWTAHYIAMRALHWPDAFPHQDLGIMKALNETKPKTILAHAEPWRPWRAYAVMHLWHSLETCE